MKSEIEAKIEYREIIGEANPGGYQPIRFTRVQYKASRETHIDILKFQRGRGSACRHAHSSTPLDQYAYVQVIRMCGGGKSNSPPVGLRVCT